MSCLSVTIMAHPRRAQFVHELQKTLNYPANVVWDRKNSRWDTGRRAMLAGLKPPVHTHHLVLQDDAIICRDLIPGISEALPYVPPSSPISLYTGNSFRIYVQRVVRGNTSWLTMPQMHWGVGIVLPTHLIRDMTNFCDRLIHVDNYDKRISRWCQARNLTVYYPWPNLVDHRTVKDSPSLVRGRTGNRYSVQFLGAKKSALDLKWDGHVAKVVHQPRKYHDSTKTPKISTPLPVEDPSEAVSCGCCSSESDSSS